MSYHNDPYRVDYLKIYPCLKERPDVLAVLKKSDRKMKYMEVDLKIEQRRKNAENGAESYVSSKEDSLERLIYSAKCQFADDAEGVEDAVIRKDNLRRLRAALDQLSEEERVLIHTCTWQIQIAHQYMASILAKTHTQLICEKPCRHISYARLHSMAGLSAVTMSSIARIMLEMYFALLK